MQVSAWARLEMLFLALQAITSRHTNARRLSRAGTVGALAHLFDHPSPYLAPI